MTMAKMMFQMKALQKEIRERIGKSSSDPTKNERKKYERRYVPRKWRKGKQKMR